ncbi:MAG: hypothetical protein U0U67_01120 [Chitinophagales bacterium]
MTIRVKAFLYTIGIIGLYLMLVVINFCTGYDLPSWLDTPIAFGFGIVYFVKAPLSYLYLLIGSAIIILPLYLIIYFILKKRNKTSTQDIP